MAARNRKEKGRTRYSDEDRANALAALAANGGNVSLTSRQLSIPRGTLKQWARGERHPEAAQLSQEKKGPLADALEAVAWKLAESLEGKVGEAKLQPTATSLGIVIDKMQLLRNKPTEIQKQVADIDLQDVPDDELDRQIADLEGRTGKAGPGPP